MSSTSRALQVDYRNSNYNTTTAAAVATVASIIVIFFSSVPFPSFPFSRISLLFSILSSSSSFFSFSPFRFNSSSSFFSFSLFHSLPIPLTPFHLQPLLPYIITTNIIILALYSLLIRFCFLTVLIPILR